jgi:hypothetical protein
LFFTFSPCSWWIKYYRVISYVHYLCPLEGLLSSSLYGQYPSDASSTSLGIYHMQTSAELGDQRHCAACARNHKGFLQTCILQDMKINLDITPKEPVKQGQDTSSSSPSKNNFGFYKVSIFCQYYKIIGCCVELLWMRVHHIKAAAFRMQPAG